MIKQGFINTGGIKQGILRGGGIKQGVLTGEGGGKGNGKPFCPGFPHHPTKQVIIKACMVLLMASAGIVSA